jgi:hypothetical protein
MKKFLTTLVMVMAVVLFMASSCNAATKYDFIKSDSGVKQMVLQLDKHIRPVPVLMNYLNAMFGSPTDFYMTLVDQDCDREILAFVKKNKSLALDLTYFRVVMVMNKMRVQDNEIMFVTNWITSPDAKLATNAEHQQAAMFMQGTATFELYKIYCGAGGLKIQTESLFQDMMTAAGRT